MRKPKSNLTHVIPPSTPTVALFSATWDINSRLLRKKLEDRRKDHTDLKFDNTSCNTDDCCSFAAKLSAFTEMEFW